MKPIPLFGEGINADSSVVSRQRRLNCFYDVRRDQDKAAIIVRGTPGFEEHVIMPQGPIRGWTVVGSLLYVVAGSMLYSVTTGGVVTGLGTLSTSAGLISMKDNAVQLGIVDGVSLYCYTLVTGDYFQTSLNAAG